MSVDARHPSCFVADGRLFAVPTSSDHSVEATRRSRQTGDGLSVGGAGTGRWAAVGAVVGGSFLAGVAAVVWRVDGLFALTVVAVVGAVVGLVLAIGTRAIFTDEGESPTSLHEPLPAVEIPWDVARGAPADSTGEELILWATLTSRYRDACRALAAADEADDRFVDADEAEGRAAEGESRYRKASEDYEPVARLLGLRLP